MPSKARVEASSVFGPVGDIVLVLAVGATEHGAEHLVEHRECRIGENRIHLTREHNQCRQATRREAVAIWPSGRSAAIQR